MSLTGVSFRKTFRTLKMYPISVPTVSWHSAFKVFLSVFQPMRLQCTQGVKHPEHCEYPESCDQNVLSGNTVGKPRISQKKVPMVYLSGSFRISPTSVFAMY